MFSFKINYQSKTTKARVGLLTTPHGVINTPAFFPVGTQATIKSLSPEELMQTGTEGILANTYHLYLRPGEKVFKNLGGLHKLMNWSKPIMTDSAGFQVFSLGFGIEHDVGKMVNLYGDDLIAGQIMESKSQEMVVRTKLCKIEEDGPTFISHLDGSVHFFPPEKSIAVQNALGADLMVALDECTSPLHNYDYTKASMERTHRWAVRSLQALGNNSKQKMYGVIQGGPFTDLRKASAKFIGNLDFFGMGIGGALVSKKTMCEILEWIHPILPTEKPRHLFGIGSIDDIFRAVERGVDTFDCVTPTRLGRMGHLLTKGHRLNTKQQYAAYKQDKFRLDITKAIFLTDKNSVDPGCHCYTCQNYSRGYLCHLFRAKELLAYRLATIHNVFFMQQLMNDIREAVKEERLAKLKKDWLNYSNSI